MVPRSIKGYLLVLHSHPTLHRCYLSTVISSKTRVCVHKICKPQLTKPDHLTLSSWMWRRSFLLSFQPQLNASNFLHNKQPIYTSWFEDPKKYLAYQQCCLFKLKGPSNNAILSHFIASENSYTKTVQLCQEDWLINENDISVEVAGASVSAHSNWETVLIKHCATVTVLSDGTPFSWKYVISLERPLSKGLDEAHVSTFLSLTYQLQSDRTVELRIKENTWLNLPNVTKKKETCEKAFSNWSPSQMHGTNKLLGIPAA